jgi:hypothetical protein
MGQQINVTLLDFGRRHDDVTNGDTLSVDRADRKLGGCAIQYGYIMDQSAVVNKNTTICATANESQRSRFVYQSTGSRVEIVLAAAQAEYGSKQNKFLLGFEGKAARCVSFYC